MSDIILTPEQRAAAVAAAWVAVDKTETLTAADPSDINLVVNAALDRLEQPVTEAPEPPNRSLVKGQRADGGVDLYERNDAEGPNDAGVHRNWYYMARQVWLTWELVLFELEKRGPEGVAVYEVFTPQQSTE